MQVLHHVFQALLKGSLAGACCSRAILLAFGLCACEIAIAQVPMPSVLGVGTERAGDVVFVAGAVNRQGDAGGSKSLEKGQSLREGDRIQTQVDGYVYVRMVDGGLLVVRPSSELHIDKWRFDPLQPQLAEIRYTLTGGVARYVSGRGSQAAKDRFRFNTPIAAIGVRGTDFTVFADAMLTRVTVRSGGVVVSSFGAGCRADALGPCDGDTATELFASAREKMIQFRQGDVRPELVDANASPSPDKVRPPAPSEPVASRRPAASTDVAIETYRAQQVVSSYVPPEKGGAVEPVPAAPETVLPVAPEPIAPEPVPPSTSLPTTPSINAAWGRISSEPGSNAPKASLEDIMNGRSLIASNRYYAVAGTWPDKLALPNAGSAEFKLTAHQGIILDKVANQALDSVASNAFLRIDFANRLFSTGFDLQAKDVTARIEGSGGVGNDGTLLSTPFFSSTLVQGVVGGPRASEAVYIYQRTLSKQFDAAGVASWGK